MDIYGTFNVYFALGKTVICIPERRSYDDGHGRCGEHNKNNIASRRVDWPHLKKKKQTAKQFCKYAR